MTALRWFALMNLILLSASCGSDVDGNYCDTDMDCATGERCNQDDLCVIPCRHDRDCDPALTCGRPSIKNDVGYRSCQPKSNVGGPASPCKADFDCYHDANYCQDGRCQNSCGDGVMNGQESDIDCGNGYIQTQGCSRCAAGKKCLRNGDCAALSCQDGKCSPCRDDSDCNWSYSCMLGICEIAR